ncbi:MAG: hypothetical protein LBQ61_10340 [Spirochaetales bacterium]|jgi:hypothetical protein|nr:hypothetical protein [Spirochaetales bacterium]
MKKSSPSTNPSPPSPAGILFTVLCVFGALLGFWLFWSDLNRVLAERSEQPVGRVTYKRHTVQRRLEDRLVWSLLPAESPVYNGDLIRTAELSDATITFVSQDRVTLSENSLIHIQYNEETQSFIELFSGNLSLFSVSGKMGVLWKNQKLFPDSGGSLDVRLVNGGVETRIRAGRAELTGAAGLHTLEAGQGAALSGEGPVEVTPALIVTRPLPNQEFNAGTDPEPLAFAWTGAEPSASLVRLEVARNRNFSDPVYSAGSDANEAVVPLSPGTWWWRLFQEEPPGEALEGRLTILPPPLPAAEVPLSPPALPAEAAPPSPSSPRVSPSLLPASRNLYPPGDTIVDAYYLRSSSRIIFSWNSVAGANGYIWTLRRGLSVNLHLVREPRFVFTDLPSLDNGIWDWQVEAVFLDSAGGISRHGLSAESRFILAVPKPLAPQVDSPGIIYER